MSAKETQGMCTFEISFKIRFNERFSLSVLDRLIYFNTRHKYSNEFFADSGKVSSFLMGT